MHEHHPNPLVNSIINIFLLVTGAITAKIGLEYTDLILGIILKITSLVSFGAFMLINWHSIIHWLKVYFKKK